MSIVNISLTSEVGKLVLCAKTSDNTIISNVVSRLAALALSPAAALDFCIHSLAALTLLPQFIYVVGKSIFVSKEEFILPWQHLQRVRNAVAGILFGSLFGVFHAYAGLVAIEPTDKHAVVGMLASNVNSNLETLCSPIHSLSIVEELAEAHPLGTDSSGVKKEVFSKRSVEAIRDARDFEHTLERLQAQEFIHKITNVTLFIMARIVESISNSRMSEFQKEVLHRLAGLLVPILTVLDLTIALVVQTVFLAIGAARLISGRGLPYTEVTRNPLMHVTFLVQAILKAVGTLLGTCVWFAHPLTGFKVSLVPGHLFFKMQMSALMTKIKLKMHYTKDNRYFVVPIVFGQGPCTPLSVPTHSMHKTYLIVEKKAGNFNLYWVNRPSVDVKMNMNTKDALEQIGTMLNARFPFMDMEKVMNFPITGEKPEFSGSTPLALNLLPQGNYTNCVVSNLFGMLATLDHIEGKGSDIAELRYKVTREALLNDYSFYENDLFPYGANFSLRSNWNQFKTHLTEPI